MINIHARATPCASLVLVTQNSGQIKGKCQDGRGTGNMPAGPGSCSLEMLPSSSACGRIAYRRSVSTGGTYVKINCIEIIRGGQELTAPWGG